jgi:hypothetical protein
VGRDSDGLPATGKFTPVGFRCLPYRHDNARARGASNEKIKEELGWHPQYESCRRGYFGDVAAGTPGGVAN